MSQSIPPPQLLMPTMSGTASPPQSPLSPLAPRRGAWRPSHQPAARSSNTCPPSAALSTPWGSSKPRSPKRPRDAAANWKLHPLVPSTPDTAALSAAASPATSATPCLSGQLASGDMSPSSVPTSGETMHPTTCAGTMISSARATTWRAIAEVSHSTSSFKRMCLKNLRISSNCMARSVCCITSSKATVMGNIRSSPTQTRASQNTRTIGRGRQLI
mmetsp:Transcript_76958/g.213878  ORF Transcript_76958/g.213878 Transcript_76958/m.213878 type:complete len:216 (+) Transcript_76958:213-860(+)